MPRIERLDLHRFRGATATSTIAFDPAQPAVLLFGENGTGKSTIIDAIDAVCNALPGSLKDRSSTEPRDHLPSLGHASGDWHVTLHAGAESWQANWKGRGIVVSGPAARPKVEILRRKRLLDLIEAKPSERYQTLQRFVDVSKMEKCEETLGKAVQEAKKSETAAIIRLQASEEALHRLWADERGEGASAPAWARERLREGVADLTERSRGFQTATQAINAVNTASGLRASRATEAAMAATVAKAAEDALRAQQQQQAERRAELVALLESTQRFLEPPFSPGECPVCERSVDPAELRARVGDRLAEMKALAQALDNVSNARREAETALSSLQGAERQLADASAAARAALSALPPFPGCALPGSVDEDSSAISALANGLLSEYEDVQRRLNQYNAISSALEGCTDAREEAVQHARVRKVLENAADTVRRQRHAYTSGVLDEVAVECKRLYEKLHPGENLGLEAFRLDPNTRGSVLQAAHFAGEKDVPPQAYFSESHLDTLGFCMWLAIVKRTHAGKCIVVLDDLFTSVDGPHLQRLVDLLAEEAEVLEQIILTTHYRYWRDKYRNGQGTKNIQMVELGRWSLSTGIRAGRTLPASAEIDSRLAQVPMDRQGVASLSGILLESVLDHLALTYRCSLPRNAANEYTLGDLLGGVTKLMKKLEVIREKEDGTEERISLKPLLDPIHEIKFIRNQVGAHHNPLGADVPDQDVERFGRETIRFVDAFICAHCGEMPKNSRGTHRACRCNKTRMEPLEIA